MYKYTKTTTAAESKSILIISIGNKATQNNQVPPDGSIHVLEDGLVLGLRRGFWLGREN